MYALAIGYSTRVVLSLRYVWNGANGMRIYADAGWVCAGAPTGAPVPHSVLTSTVS